MSGPLTCKGTWEQISVIGVMSRSQPAVGFLIRMPWWSHMIRQYLLSMRFGLVRGACFPSLHQRICMKTMEEWNSEGVRSEVSQQGWAVQHSDPFSCHEVNLIRFVFNIVTHSSAPFQWRFSGSTESVCHRMFPFSLICIAISYLPFKS